MKQVFLLLSILLLSLSNSEGCTCIGSDTIQVIPSKQIVVSGTIISNEIVELPLLDTVMYPNSPGFREAHYSMVVDRVYNGKRVADTIEIQTGMGGGDCGFSFTIGQSYIVFASSKPERFFRANRIIKTNICTHTQLYSKETENRIIELTE